MPEAHQHDGDGEEHEDGAPGEATGVGYGRLCFCCEGRSAHFTVLNAHLLVLNAHFLVLSAHFLVRTSTYASIACSHERGPPAPQTRAGKLCARPSFTAGSDFQTGFFWRAVT
ncbi:hypothetical protein GA0115243_110698 [Streptomyces sp. ScaeMP-e83]|nr:hypothetical protein GA0115243_110698 [Streptomyces sp. ScaeMP-e83]